MQIHKCLSNREVVLQWYCMCLLTVTKSVPRQLHVVILQVLELYYMHISESVLLEDKYMTPIELLHVLAAHACMNVCGINTLPSVKIFVEINNVNNVNNSTNTLGLHS